VKSCEYVQVNGLEHLVGGASALPAEDRAHLAWCKSCRAVVTEIEAIWNELGELPVPELRGDFVGDTEGLIRSFHRRPIMISKRMFAAGLAAAVVLGVLVASLIPLVARGKAGAQSTATVAALPDTALPQFLILIRERPGAPRVAPPVAEMIGAYSQWAQALARRGRLVGAEKLSDGDGVFFVNHNGVVEPDLRPVNAGTEVVGGYFIIRAQDRQEAEAIARECPGLKYGSVIELRQIDRG
jgi:hypothetical protein